MLAVGAPRLMLVLASAARAAVLVAGVGLGSSSARAEPAPLVRTTGAIVLDGVGNEAVWRAIAPLPVTVYEPTYGASPSQRTVMRVAYDERALYVLVEAFDNDPSDVRANSLERDVYAGDDTIGVIIDPFGDDDAGLWFYTTPAGTRAEGTIAADMASGEPDWSWDAPWQSAAKVTDQGWSAELRVPFRTLGFRDAGGLVHMGLSVYRWLPRHNERHIWPNVPPRWPRAYAKPSRLQDVVLQDVRAERAVQLAPYTLAGYDAVGSDGEPRLEAGLDLKYAWSSAATLDVTVNTDFAQAEADDARINLTRFPLFFPEKRQFFLERSSVFDVQLGGLDRLFYSRSIGLIDGEPIRILGGARAIVRTGRWDVGVLDMQTGPHDENKSENLAVARVRRLLGDGTSSVGAIATSRVDTEGAYNAVAGADAVVRVVGDEYLSATAAYASSDDAPEAGAPSDGGRLWASWERRRLQGLRYMLGVEHGGRGFEPGLGYQQRRGFSAVTSEVGHLWLSEPGWPAMLGWLGAVDVSADAQVVRRTSDSALDTARVSPEVVINTRRGHELSIATEHARENVAEPFALTSEVMVPAGTYVMQRARLGFYMSSGVRLRTGVSVEAGDFYGGRSVGGAITPTWNASRHVNLDSRYEVNAIELADGTSLTTQLASVRARLALDTRLSMSVLAQYASVDDVWAVNTRLRWHAGEGRDLWLVADASEGLDEPGRANLWQLMVKYTHTLQL